MPAYSAAAKPPTETQSGHVELGEPREMLGEEPVDPGFARPIELSMPTSVSAIRTGAFPARGSGVTVFVTKASSERATSGAVSASRQPDAFRITRNLTVPCRLLQPQTGPSMQSRFHSPSISTAHP